MKALPYSVVRPNIKVGDCIGCVSNSLLGRIIRWISKDFSHIAIISRDTTNEGTGRVEVGEALINGGIVENYLSKIYESDHGKLFLIPMNCTPEQRFSVMESIAQARSAKKKYDFKSTLMAVIRPIFLSIEKFNCSEFCWWVHRRAGTVKPRFKGHKEIAPNPSQFNKWAEVTYVELDMSS